MAERLADKYEEAKEKQEDIMNRSVGCTNCITFSSPFRYYSVTSSQVLCILQNPVQ